MNKKPKGYKIIGIHGEDIFVHGYKHSKKETADLFCKLHTKHFNSLHKIALKRKMTTEVLYIKYQVIEVF